MDTELRVLGRGVASWIPAICPSVRERESKGKDPSSSAAWASWKYSTRVLTSQFIAQDASKSPFRYKFCLASLKIECFYCKTGDTKSLPIRSMSNHVENNVDGFHCVILVSKTLSTVPYSRVSGV